MQLIISLFKWVFTSNELVWFLSGGLSFAAITYCYLKLKETTRLSIGNFSFAVLSALTFSFTALWAISSYQEHEVIAANLGLVIFGGLAAVFGIVAYRLTTRIEKVAKSGS